MSKSLLLRWLFGDLIYRRMGLSARCSATIGSNILWFIILCFFQIFVEQNKSFHYLFSIKNPVQIWTFRDKVWEFILCKGVFGGEKELTESLQPLFFKWICLHQLEYFISFVCVKWLILDLSKELGQLFARGDLHVLLKSGWIFCFEKSFDQLVAIGAPLWLKKVKKCLRFFLLLRISKKYSKDYDTLIIKIIIFIIIRQWCQIFE